MPVVTGCRQRHQDRRIDETSVDDDQRIIGYVGPKRRSKCRFSVGVSAKVCRGYQVRAKRHQRYETARRVRAAGTVSVASLASERRPILSRIRQSQRRAVDAVERELSPPVSIRLDRSTRFAEAPSRRRATPPARRAADVAARWPVPRLSAPRRSMPDRFAAEIDPVAQERLCPAMSRVLRRESCDPSLRAPHHDPSRALINSIENARRLDHLCLRDRHCGYI